MPQAIGYIRVSSEEQAERGSSLAAQRRKLLAWAEFTESELIAVHEDAGLSGGRADNRPALQEALADVRRHRCPLVVYSLSRLSRSVRDTLLITEELERAGGDLVSLSEDLNTSTAAGRMVFRMLTVLAEFERDQLAERTTMAMGHLRRQHRRISRHIPYGFRLAEDGQTLEPVEDEQVALNLMAALREKGLSYRQICRKLGEAGHEPRNGGTWDPSTVRGFIERYRKLQEVS